MSAPGPPTPKVFGGYLLLKALGQGAMGDVSLARPLREGRGLPSPVVVKRLHASLVDKDTFVARFRHEAKVAVAVNNPHVAKVYDVGSVGETLYIAMEYVQGWPLHLVLDAVMQSGRHASVASIVDLMVGGLLGLQALHTAKDPDSQEALGVVHRDIAPKNLMVGEDGQMRLIDLGLGKSNAQEWRTRTGMVMGSPGYMPPEQVMGSRVGPQADLYAMGVVMFEALTLRNYIRRGTISEMLEASLQPKFVAPSKIRSDIPKKLDRILERVLRYNPDQRYPSAETFISELQRAVPPEVAGGGMNQLIAELFGAERNKRDAELTALLALPNPDQEFESRPTQVFVMATGIAPDDLAPTRHTPYPNSETTLPTQLVTAKQPAYADPKASSPSNTSLVRPVPAEAKSYPNSQASLPAVSRPAGDQPVTMKTLLVAMVVMLTFGLLIGGVVVGAVLHRNEEPPNTIAIVPNPDPSTPNPDPKIRPKTTPEVAPKPAPPPATNLAKLPPPAAPSSTKRPPPTKTVRRSSRLTPQQVRQQLIHLKEQAHQQNLDHLIFEIQAKLNALELSSKTAKDVKVAHRAFLRLKSQLKSSQANLPTTEP